MALSERDEVFHRIRLLSAIELAASELLGPEVIKASRLGLTWKEIGRAAGFSDSRAHRRWSEIVKGERSGPRTRNRGFAILLRDLRSDELSLMPEVLGELGKYLRSPQPANRYAEVIRHYLTHDLKRPFVERAKEKTTVFIMAELDLQLRVTEPSLNDRPSALIVSLNNVFDSEQIERIELGDEDGFENAWAELRRYLDIWLVHMQR